MRVSNYAIFTGSEFVLFVDDKEALGEISEEIPAGLGYGVTSRTGEAVKSRGKVCPASTLPLPTRLRRKTGLELAKEILTVRPDPRAVII